MSRYDSELWPPLPPLATLILDFQGQFHKSHIPEMGLIDMEQKGYA